MKFVLTGATGFIGSHLLQALVSHGHDVTALVRSNQQPLSHVTWIETDLTSESSIPTIKQALEGAEIVIHFAALIPAQSIGTETEEEMKQENVDATRYLLESMPTSVKQVISSSSIDIYGIPQAAPIAEDHPIKPVTAYGVSKAAAESAARDICAAKSVPLTSLRFTQIYGPRERPIKAIPLFVRAIANDETPTLFGDGSDKRDYLYVSDAVDAVLLAMNNGTSGIFNIASGVSVSLKDVIDTLIAISGKDISPRYEDRRKAKIDILLDISRAKSALGFEPKTLLLDGLKTTYDYYLAHNA